MKSWTGPGPHKCEWTAYGFRFRKLTRALPKGAQFWLRRRWNKWPIKKVNRCSEEATAIAKCDHFEGYNNLPVCAKHLKDVERSNSLDRAIKDGSLDRAIREAEAKKANEP